MTLVVDASTLVHAGVGTGEAAEELRARLMTEDCHAPHLIDAEVGNVLRRETRRGDISAQVAEVVLLEVPYLVDYRYAHGGELALRAWDLRENLTFYDALYVALAGALNAPLITLDRRLANAAIRYCSVEVMREDG